MLCGSYTDQLRSEVIPSLLRKILAFPLRSCSINLKFLKHTPNKKNPSPGLLELLLYPSILIVRIIYIIERPYSVKIMVSRISQL